MAQPGQGHSQCGLECNDRGVITLDGVGVGFGNEKISDPVGMCFLTRGLQNW